MTTIKPIIMAERKGKIDAISELTSAIGNMPIEIPEWCKTDTERRAYFTGAVDRENLIGGAMYEIMQEVQQ